MDFTIVIRTFKDRLDCALDLKHICDSYLNKKNETLIANTRDQTTFYSRAFCVVLADLLVNISTKYVLLLEDDMVISKKTNAYLEKALQFDIDSIWLSVYSQKMIDTSFPISSYLRGLKTKEKGIHYSGAILVKTSFLKEYLNDFFLNHLHIEEVFFDVSFSKYLEKNLGFIPFKEGFFATSKSIKSSLEDRKKEKNIVSFIAEDPFFDFSDHYV